METNRIWCAEQITVSPDLPGVLKEYTKAVIRESPADVLAFSAEYFRKAGGIEEPKSNNLSEEDLANFQEQFAKYDKNGDNKIDVGELGNFIREDLEFEIGDDELEKVMDTLDKDGSGALEFDEVVAWWSDMQQG
eukprot:g2871.t1